MQVNRALLRQRAKVVHHSLAVLQRYAGLSQETILATTEAVDAAKCRLIEAIEAAISIWTHLASRLSQRTPESYSDCFAALAEAGLLPGDLA